MTDAAENIEQQDNEQGGEQNVNNPMASAWRDALAGDNSEALETLKGYESPDKFLEEFNALKNKNWRDDFAGEDEKLKSQLERFSTPADLGKSFREAQDKIRSGQAKSALPENATEDDIKAYRAEHGIPEEASGYMKDLPEGLALGEEDMPIAEVFMDALHSTNAPPEVAHALIAKYDEFKQQEMDSLAEADTQHAQETEDMLRQAWGSDFRANTNLVGALIDKEMSAEAKDFMLNARGPDGKGIFNHPDVMKFFANISRQVNPINKIISPTGNPEQTLNDRIAEIEKFMRTNRGEYNKDEKMQAELRELYDIRTQSKGSS